MNSFEFASLLAGLAIGGLFLFWSFIPTDKKNETSNKTEDNQPRVLRKFKDLFGDAVEIIDAFEDKKHPLERSYYKEVVIARIGIHVVRIEWVCRKFSPLESGTMVDWRVMYGFRERMVRGETILDKDLHLLTDDNNPPKLADMIAATNYVTSNPLSNIAGLLGLTKYLLPKHSPFG